jgi:hypothetical protein
MNNASKWTKFALSPLGRYGDIFGQNHKILLKIHRILEKCIFFHKHLLNPSESSDEKRHRLLFPISQTQFVYFISHFWVKTADFFLWKYVKQLTSK